MWSEPPTAATSSFSESLPVPAGDESVGDRQGSHTRGDRSGSCPSACRYDGVVGERAIIEVEQSTAERDHPWIEERDRCDRQWTIGEVPDDNVGSVRVAAPQHQTAVLGEGRVDRDPLRGIVVSGDRRDLDPCGVERTDRAIEGPDRLGRRARTVVDVPGHDDEIDGALDGGIDQPVQERLLVREQPVGPERPAQMPVRRVENLHSSSMTTGCDRVGDGPPGSDGDHC